MNELIVGQIYTLRIYKFLSHTKPNDITVFYIRALCVWINNNKNIGRFVDKEGNVFSSDIYSVVDYPVSEPISDVYLFDYGVWTVMSADEINKLNMDFL